MASFLTNALNKVDKKGRVSVPSLFRQAVSGGSFQGVALYPAIKLPCLEGSDLAFFDEISRRIYGRYSPISPQSSKLALRVLGRMEPLSFDTEGRILLPQELRDYAGIGEHAKFVGLGPKFQIWDPDRLRDYEASDDDLFDEVEALEPLFGGGL